MRIYDTYDTKREKANDSFTSQPPHRGHGETIAGGQVTTMDPNSQYPSPTAQLAQMRAALAHPALSAYLHWKYASEPVLTRGGVPYPIAVFPVPFDQQGDLESVLARPVQPEAMAMPLLGDPAYRQLIEAAGVRPFDGRTFTLRTLEVVDEAPRLHAGLGGYFAMLDSCDTLEWELLRHIDQAEGINAADLRRLDARLPLRTKLHKQVANPVRSGAYRQPAISVSVLLAYTHRGQTHTLLRRRSANVAVHPQMLHVVPAFMMGPATAHIADEYSVRHNCYREYLEELFARPEARADEQDWRYFYADPRLRQLEAWLQAGSATLLVTGVTVNLMSLRHEINVLLWFRDDEWYDRHLGPKAEGSDRLIYNEEFAASDIDGGSLTMVIPPDADDAEILQRYPEIAPTRMVPFGAGTLWQGIAALRHLR